MKIDWSPLDRELNRWREEGRVLPLWWRDDDAVAVTPALDRLAGIAGRMALPVHLAIVPANVEPALAEHVSARPTLIPLVHGWTHSNHSPPKVKKAEFGEERPLEEMVEECEYAMRRMSLLFGSKLTPVFVPPWNRMPENLIAELSRLGFRGVSTFTPREDRLAAPGLWRVNAHLDPINWRADGVLHDPAEMVRQIAGQLADRREGRADPDEPYGLLTHHLVHDEQIWTFVDAVMQKLCSGPVRFWRADEETKPTGEAK